MPPLPSKISGFPPKASLMESFINKYSIELGILDVKIEEKVMKMLKNYNWPVITVYIDNKSAVKKFTINSIKKTKSF